MFEPLNFLLKSPTALRHPPPWANLDFFSPFGFTQSPLQAGLPGTPPEPPKAQRAAPLPWDPPNYLSHGGGSRSVFARVELGRGVIC